MSRSIKKSIAIPQPVRDALAGQIENGVLDYPSENAAWIGLARYQLLIGKPHPVTAPIALMHQRHQDLIDDFLHAHSRQFKARIPDSTGDWRARLSRVTCLGSGLKAATAARSVDLTRCTASRS